MSSGRCLINTGLPDEDLIQDFENLHEDFKYFSKNYIPADGMSLPMLIRYMVHCYDRNSAIAVQYRVKWIVKKKESATRAKFPTYPDNGVNKFTEEAIAIIANKDPEFLKVIMKYLTIQYDADFELYVVYKELHHNVLTELMQYKLDNPAQVAKAKDNAESIQDDINRLEYKIFSGEEERTLKSMLYETAYKASLELRPEAILTKKENGEDIVDEKPYGNEYKVGAMKFVGDE